MIKTLGEWLHTSEEGSEDVHQSVLRLARACSMIDTEENDESKSSWITFVEYAVSNLVYGDYYNLGKIRSSIFSKILSRFMHYMVKKIYKYFSIFGLGIVYIDLRNWKMSMEKSQ